MPKALVRSGTAWEIEDFHRRWLADYLEENHPDEAVVISDADEVPTRKQLEVARRMVGIFGSMSLPMKTSVRFANWIERPITLPLLKPKVSLGKRLRRYSRDSFSVPALGPRGVHLSYLGIDVGRLKQKYASFAHRELDHQRSSTARVLSFASAGMVHHVGRSEKLGAGVLCSEPPAVLNEFQRLLLSTRADWFDFNAESPGWLVQIRMSQALTDFLFDRADNLSDSDELSGSWKTGVLRRYLSSRIQWFTSRVKAWSRSLQNLLKGSAQLD